VVLEFYLAASQVCLIGPDLAKTAPNLGRLLRREAAVFVKFDWLVRHIRPALPGLHHPDFEIGRTRQPRNNTKSPYFGSPQVCSYARSALTLAFVRGFQLSNRKNLAYRCTQYGTGVPKIQLKEQRLDGYGGALIDVAKGAAKRIHQRCLAGADWAADANAQGPVAVVHVRKSLVRWVSCRRAAMSERKQAPPRSSSSALRFAPPAR
jgi:hypothetical protein